MFKVKVITVGKVKETWLKEALAEYEKRLSSTLLFEWVLFNSESELEEAALKEKKLIVLDLKGTLISSEELSTSLFSSWGSRISIGIGGAEGFSPRVTNHAKLVLSFSRLTFTHQIVRLLLAEQLYRAIEIEKGSSYHK